MQIFFYFVFIQHQPSFYFIIVLMQKSKHLIFLVFGIESRKFDQSCYSLRKNFLFYYSIFFSLNYFFAFLCVFFFDFHKKKELKLWTFHFIRYFSFHMKNYILKGKSWQSRKFWEKKYLNWVFSNAFKFQDVKLIKNNSCNCWLDWKWKLWSRILSLTKNQFLFFFRSLLLLFTHLLSLLVNFPLLFDYQQLIFSLIFVDEKLD